MGAAAVLETAAETPPTVYHELVADICKPIAQKPSSIHVYNGDNGHGALAEEDVLKKSITKGGLLRNGSARDPFEA